MRISASWLAFVSSGGIAAMAEEDGGGVGLAVERGGVGLRLRLRGDGASLGMKLSFADGRRSVMV